MRCAPDSSYLPGPRLLGVSFGALHDGTWTTAEKHAHCKETPVARDTKIRGESATKHSLRNQLRMSPNLSRSESACFTKHDRNPSILKTNLGQTFHAQTGCEISRLSAVKRNRPRTQFDDGTRVLTWQHEPSRRACAEQSLRTHLAVRTKLKMLWAH